MAPEAPRPLDGPWASEPAGDAAGGPGGWAAGGFVPGSHEPWRSRLAAAPEVWNRLREMPLQPSLLQEVVLPLIDQLTARLERGGRPPVLALNGPVGAGKSTLAGALGLLAPLAGLRLAVASIDDVYLPARERRRVLAGNPFGVSRVPPGSHDLPLLLEALATWRAGGTLRLPRFDKTLASGQGDRSGWRETPADAVVLEGWLMGCRALGPERSAAAAQDRGPGAALEELSLAERAWLPRWDRELESYGPLWTACDGLWLLRPVAWSLPRRWRFQAEARQRRRGGGWLPAEDLDRLVRATLHSLPPALYQDPLLERGLLTGQDRMESGLVKPGERDQDAGDAAPDHLLQGSPAMGPHHHAPVGEDNSQGLPLLGAVELDGRRRCRRIGRQPSASSASSAIG